MNEERKQHGSFLREIISFALLALLIVLPIRFFIAQPFIVQGASMQPTFESGEYLIVDQISRRFEAPVRGEVVIFKFPKDPSKFFIKRIVGLPGETISIQGVDVTIVNSEFPNGIVLDEPYLSMENMRHGVLAPITLGNDEYFVLGDNRRASSDSRVWGPLPEDLIVGQAFLRLLPIQKTAHLPGDHGAKE